MTDSAPPGSTRVASSKTCEQIALVGWLRWRMLVNSLRTGREQFDFIARVLVGLLAGLLALGIGIGAGAGAYALVRLGRLAQLQVVTWVAFLGWQFLSILTAATAIEFDSRSLLRYPLRFSTYCALNLAYGLSDMFALATLFGLACVAAGMVAARAGLLVWVVPILVVFAAFNLIFNRYLFAWIERVLARRRGREALFLVLILGMVFLQLVGVQVERFVQSGGAWIVWLRHAAYALPPGVAGLALETAARGDANSAVLATVLLAGYALLFAVFLTRRLRWQYAGEDLSEVPAPSLAPAEAARAAGWRLPGVSEPVAAIFEKEIRYFLRIGPLLILLVLPLAFVLLLLLIGGGPKGPPKLFSRAPEFIFPSAVGYVFLLLTPYAHNVFAYDRHGVQLLLMAPVRFRDVLLGKNLAVSAWLIVETSLVSIAVSVFAAPPGARVAAATIAALLFALLVNLAVGNLLSLYFPRAHDVERFRSRQSGATILLGLLLQVVVYGIVGMILFFARLFGKMELGALALLGLAAAAWPLYSAVLGEADRLAANSRETLTRELCK